MVAMTSRSRMVYAGFATAGLFLLVQLGALALVDPFIGAGYRAVEDPADPRNSVYYLLAILLITGLILLVIRFGVERLLRGVVIAMSAVLSVYVFSVLVPPAVVVEGVHVLAWVLAAGLAVALVVYPEWYVIDVTGVLIAAGGAGIFGISFGPLPAILLLGVLAVYDAISVYRTEHMLTLAESVTALRLPLLLVIPLSLSYSFLEEGALPPAEGEPDGPVDDVDREAFFVGLGDTVMPTVMVVSAAVFSGAPPLAISGLALNVPAATAMVGTFLGLAGLLWLVSRGRAQAGLPLLTGGAIGGYLVGTALAGIPLVEAVGLSPYL